MVIQITQVIQQVLTCIWNKTKGGGSGEYGSTNPLPYIGINGFGDGQGVGTYVGG